MSGLYFLVHRQPSPVTSIEIRTLNCVFGGDVVPWKECLGFWLFQGPDYVELHIERKDGRRMIIQTGTIDPQDIQTVLSQLIPELQGRRERVLDRIARYSKL